MVTDNKPATRMMDKRIEQLRRWLDATRDGAITITELDREIIAELFKRIDDGNAAVVHAERESRRADELDREAKHARHVLWAVVMASGGRVEVAAELLATSPHDCTLTREIDQFKSCYVFGAK